MTALEGIVSTDIFGKKPTIPTTESILALNEQHSSIFLSYYNDPATASIKPNLRIYRFLENQLDQFDYLGETLSAQSSLERGGGNCITLAILTTAYANLVGLELSYQESQSVPIFNKQGGFETLSTHVTTRIYDPTFVPEEGTIYLERPSIEIDYFPSRGDWRGKKVSNDRFLGMYYRNIATELLQNNEIAKAGWWIHEAYLLAPEDISNLNTLAVIYRHLNEHAIAEKIYKLAMEIDENDIHIVHNYRVLLISEGRLEEAKILEDKLLTLDDPSPFRWYEVATDAFNTGNYTRAYRFFDRVIEKAPYLHFGYAGKARTAMALNHPNEAEELFQMALERAWDDSSEQLYRAKLSILETY
ncbi:hypothetical protein KUL49_39070 [Alteromonas sp. KUL49]|nr:hypothetical protein KUL49_39070 [Alteromonas sp. KUL49]